MILLLNTSSSECEMTFMSDGGGFCVYKWQADRSLARDLLSFINSKLSESGKDWSDIRAIGVFEGPGSFTGLRIGLTVMNTIADTQNIPIVGGRGDSWKNDVLAKLDKGSNQKIVLPFYGSEANITSAKK